jgi:hypothetical protein
MAAKLWLLPAGCANAVSRPRSAARSGVAGRGARCGRGLHAPRGCSGGGLAADDGDLRGYRGLPRRGGDPARHHRTAAGTRRSGGIAAAAAIPGGRDRDPGLLAGLRDHAGAGGASGRAARRGLVRSGHAGAGRNHAPACACARQSGQGRAGARASAAVSAGPERALRGGGSDPDRPAGDSHGDFREPAGSAGARGRTPAAHPRTGLHLVYVRAGGRARPHARRDQFRVGGIRPAIRSRGFGDRAAPGPAHRARSR